MTDIGEQEKNFLIAPDLSLEARYCSACSGTMVRKRFGLRTLIAWVPSLVALILVAAVLYQWREIVSMKDECFSFWTPSDFGQYGSTFPRMFQDSTKKSFDTDAIKKEIPTRLQKTPFSAGLGYNATQQLYHLNHSDKVPYVGEPSKDIDDSWQRLIGGNTSACI